MTIRKIITPVIALALALITSLSMVTPALAASSYNGFMHSNGRSAVSYKNGPMYQYTFQNQYRFGNQYYENREDFLRAFISYLEDLIEQLEGRLDDSSDASAVSVATLSPTDVDENEATLRGRVYTANEDEVTVYFEYGKSSSSLSDETTHKVIEDPTNTYTFTATISNLDEDTLYYYRAVAEDEQGDADRGSILSFRADDSSNSKDEPSLDTNSATNVTDDAADLRVAVDMNDFNNGHVFFVYGEDEDQVDDIASDYDRYADVDEDGDNLRKVSVDSDLDDSDSYSEEVSGLDSNTNIYFSICVEYENEDSDDVIVCGDTESFTTDS